MKFLLLLTSLASATTIYHAKPTDEILAKDGDYSVILSVDDDGQSAGDLLCKKTKAGKIEVIADNDDVNPIIEKTLPHDIALNLETQMAKKEINQNGGAAKVQAKGNEDIKKHGLDYYNYLTPLYKEAYKANGVDLDEH